jgi:transposase-like protein
MDRNACQQFFLNPGAIGQLRYEVLRAVFVDEDTARDAAERFSLSHGTVRNWVSQFNAQLGRGGPPPFSIAVPQTGHKTPRWMNLRPRPQTLASFPWNLAAVCGRDWRGSFCSCRSWPGCVSIGS